MLKEFTYKFWKISEESLGRDETPRQTSHEHFTSIWQIFNSLLYKLWINIKNIFTSWFISLNDSCVDAK